MSGKHITIAHVKELLIKAVPRLKDQIEAASSMKTLRALFKIGPGVETIEPNKYYTIRLDQVGTRTIEVIKAVRTFTGLGLRESMDLCDSVRAVGPREILTHMRGGDVLACREHFQQVGAEISILAETAS